VSPVALPFTVQGGLDIGLFSDDPATAAFYEDRIGLPFQETLRHSPTYEERFYAFNGASLKVNYSTEPMAPGGGGYRGVLVARDGIDESVDLVDPDGVRVSLVPPGHRGVTHGGVVLGVPDVAAQADFLSRALGGQVEEGGVRLGNSLVLLEDTDAEAAREPVWRSGLRYVVLYVDDLANAHDHVVAEGAEHSMEMVRLGDRCAFSWLRDPQGNWIELVQRADRSSVALPDVAPAASRWREIEQWRETGAPIGERAA
jgi:lactoylglutathione lyase